MTTSLPPNNGMKIKIGPVSINITRKMATIIISLAVAGGGGSWAVMGVATSDEVAMVKAKVTGHITADRDRGKKVDGRLDGHDEQLKGLTVKIGSIQDVQHWQTADQASVRVCQRVPQSKRRDCEKRLFKWSFDRLRDGETRPCTNLDCSD